MTHSSSCTFFRYLAFLVLLGLVNAIPLLRFKRSTGLSEQVLAALPLSNSKKSFFAIGAFTSMDEDEMAASRAGRSVDTGFIDYTF